MAYTNRGAAGMTPEQMEEERRKKRYAKQHDGSFIEIPAQPNVGPQTGKVYPEGIDPNSVSGAAYEAVTTARNELRPGLGVLSRTGETINRAGNRMQQNVTGAIDKTVPVDAFNTEKRGEPMTMDRAIPQDVRGAVPKVAENISMGVQSLPGIGEGTVPSVSRAIENFKKGNISQATGNVIATGPRTVAAAGKEFKESVVDPFVGAVKEAIPYWKQAGKDVVAGIVEDPNAPQRQRTEQVAAQGKPAGLPYQLQSAHAATTDIGKAPTTAETPGHGSSAPVNRARGTITTADGRTITAGNVRPAETSTQTIQPTTTLAPQRRGYGIMAPAMQPMETYMEKTASGGGAVRMGTPEQAAAARERGAEMKAEQPGYGLDPSLLGGKNYHGNKRREIRDANARRIAYKNAMLAARQKDVDIGEKDVANRARLGEARIAADQQAAAQGLALDERGQALEEAKFATDVASTQAAQQQEQIISNLRQQLSQESDPKRREAIQQQISDLSGEDSKWKPAKAQVGEGEFGEPIYETVLVNVKGETRRIELPEEQPVRRTVDDYFK